MGMKVLLLSVDLGLFVRLATAPGMLTPDPNPRISDFQAQADKVPIPVCVKARRAATGIGIRR